MVCSFVSSDGKLLKVNEGYLTIYTYDNVHPLVM